jgi:hypothetical protein
LGKGPLERHRLRIENTNKTGRKNGVDCINLAQDRGVWWADVNMVRNLQVS